MRPRLTLGAAGGIACSHGHYNRGVMQTPVGIILLLTLRAMTAVVIDTATSPRVASAITLLPIEYNGRAAAFDQRWILRARGRHIS